MPDSSELSSAYLAWLERNREFGDQPDLEPEDLPNPALADSQGSDQQKAKVA